MKSIFKRSLSRAFNQKSPIVALNAREIYFNHPYNAPISGYKRRNHSNFYFEIKKFNKNFHIYLKNFGDFMLM